MSVNSPLHASRYAESVSVETAREIIAHAIAPVLETEKPVLRRTLQRVLAEDIFSPLDIPARNNSAMDGYAFSAERLDMHASPILKMVGSSHAGRAYTGRVASNECVKIMTGAVIPDDCDTVVPLEDALVLETGIQISPNAVQKGDNIRLRGESIEAGALALPQGTVIRPAHIGLLASIGLSEALVYRRLRVAFFSTGDELRLFGEKIDDGGVYDSNRHTVYALLSRLGCDPVDMGTIRDDPRILEATCLKAAQVADVVITTGGVSVGAADYTKQVLEKLGEMAFWRIAMRPGHPTAFGTLFTTKKSTCFFALPGNPVSVMVSFYFFVRDALLRMMGALPSPPVSMRVRTVSALPKRQGRTEYQRGILFQDETGTWCVKTTGGQGSGILSSMTRANCVIILPADSGGAHAGDTVEIVPFEGLV
ncbi:MAG: molybdopterin molybdotransferase MoeA [Burkholderiaceae bacterium]|jgi:molybdopterin molybdotransferase|nr:molybdopterin molybdotransferase MoeA [Burkholderiaceae bacterium]